MKGNKREESSGEKKGEGERESKGRGEDGRGGGRGEKRVQESETKGKKIRRKCFLSERK